jgi:hypothetical protein
LESRINHVRAKRAPLPRRGYPFVEENLPWNPNSAKIGWIEQRITSMGLDLLVGRDVESAVESSTGVLQMLVKLCYLALVGFLAITLMGPVLALLSVLLCFAAIGLIIWMPLQLLFQGRTPKWGEAMDKSKDFGRKAVNVVTATCSTCARGAQGIHGACRGTANKVGVFLLEVFGGAAVGGVLAAVCAGPYGPRAPEVLTGVLGGAGIGMFVGLARSKSAVHVPAEQ